MKFLLHGTISRFNHADGGSYIQVSQIDTVKNRAMLRPKQRLGRFDVFIPDALDAGKLLTSREVVEIKGSCITTEVDWTSKEGGRSKVIDNYYFTAESVTVVPKGASIDGGTDEVGR